MTALDRPPLLMPHATDVPADAPALLFEGVSKWYGPVLGVNGVTLELRGGITGLVGANGAGKTTLLRLATGQLKPTLGRVSVAGVDAWDWRAKRLVGFCADADVFYEEMTGEQFVTSMAKLCGYTAADSRAIARDRLQRVGMEGRADRRVRGYSKGMRQRVKLAAALVHDPRLLVLDEPLSGIDPVGRRSMLDLFADLASEGRCLLVSSHELEALERLTDHVAIMARGRVAAVGTLAEIRELMDDHPLAVRVDCDAPRRLAALVIGWDEVAGVDAPDAAGIVVRVQHGGRFFERFNRAVLDEAIDVQRLEPLDESAHAILGYLLGGSGRT